MTSGSAVRNTERAEAPRSVAMKVLGHKMENIFRWYAIVSEPDLQRATRSILGHTMDNPSTSPPPVDILHVSK